MTWLQPVTLRAARATLAPLDFSHHDGLVEAVSDGELWKLWYTRIPEPAPDARGDRATPRLAEGRHHVALTIFDNDSGRVAGMTTYMNVDAANRRVEIGSTWYRGSVQRTSLNTQCKLALLTHAFDTLDCIAVEFRTHIFNSASRKAIERLGAKLDGILRSHQQLADGSLRDTCVYSIIASEWPSVRNHLNWQLERRRLPEAAQV
ncbi:MAG: GNAT family protein [Gammaproteobacteria bacterium]